jgi:hypothetical protein
VPSGGAVPTSTPKERRIRLDPIDQRNGSWWR